VADSYVMNEDELDLMLAARLQAALLPKGCPLECEHQVAAARNRMCGSVGGDFYDFIHLNRDQSAIVIGDVVGHGVRAALVMAHINGFLRSDTKDRSRPTRIVSALNDMLRQLGDLTNSVMSCSLLYMVFDAPSGMCILCNCGHPRPFLCNRDQCSALPLGTHDILLGVERFEATETCHTFLTGERLLLYTDGIVEAGDEHHNLFGDERLQQVICDHSESSPGECADAVMREVDIFRGGAPQGDDETIVVVDRI